MSGVISHLGIRGESRPARFDSTLDGDKISSEIRILGKFGEIRGPGGIDEFGESVNSTGYVMPGELAEIRGRPYFRRNWTSQLHSS